MRTALFFDGRFTSFNRQRAMRWDEERYGLEYDLDLFNIVAVDDFNMGIVCFAHG